MPANRQLSQQEIDAVFQRPSDSGAISELKAVPLDFRRPDRIAKSQLRAIHLLHEGFVRSLSSSLSVYLRSFISGNLISVEQLSFGEFLDGLPSPGCLVSLGLVPYDTHAVLEVNPSLVFPILDLITGGKGNVPAASRETSEIEQQLLEVPFRIIVQGLTETWKVVSNIQFTVAGLETAPQLVRVMALNEAVVAIAMEFHVADYSGMINLAIPSITIKAMGERFDQHWSLKAQTSTTDESTIFKLLHTAEVDLQVRLWGASILVRDLVELKEGAVIVFDHPVSQVIDGVVNGRPTFKGRVVSAGRKRGFVVE